MGMARGALWSRSLSQCNLAHTFLSLHGRLIYTIIHISDKQIHIPVFSHPIYLVTEVPAGNYLLSCSKALDATLWLTLQRTQT